MNSETKENNIMRYIFDFDWYQTVCKTVWLFYM